MKTRENYVKEFNEAFMRKSHQEPSSDLLKFRKRLINEEVNELFSDIDEAVSILEKGEEIPKSLLANMLKELADIQYVVSGMSVDVKPMKNLDEAFIRVHNSNMSKLGADGKPIYRDDGKIIKGPNYKEPDLDDLVS
ncbi:MAG: putative secreted protein [Parcubacteria bacterium C7867-003]|nr:MAG: putative secreted protein [Parcubacteria bacterium C7867-003]